MKTIMPILSFRLVIVFLVMFFTIGPCAAAAKSPQSMTQAEQQLVYHAQQAMAKEQFGKARQMLSKYVEKHHGDVHYLVEFTLGNALAMGGDAPAALAHYLAATSDNPGDPAVWQNMGKVYYDLHKYLQAGKSLVRAYELENPKSPETAYQAAVAFILAKKPEIARPLLEAHVNRDDRNPESKWLDALLKVYLDLGLNDRAQRLTRDLIARAGHRPH